MTGTDPETTRAMTTFAAIGAAMIGAWHLISGIAGVTSDERTETLNEVLFGIDLTIFGWFWVIIGVAQMITAVMIFRRNPVGLVVGVVWAAISAVMAAFVIFVAPVWALAVLLVDLVIIRALVHDPAWGEF